MEDPTHQVLPLLDIPIISKEDKETEASIHKVWAASLPQGTTLLFTDGSKSSNGDTASAWHCTGREESRPAMLFKGACHIGNKANIKDTEIHAIQEGLHELTKKFKDAGQIYLCVDNQNALIALSGGPTGGREYVRECLEEAHILWQRGCRVTGKWTPSHQNIIGNERADTLAKNGILVETCYWTRTILRWAKYQPRHIMSIEDDPLKRNKHWGTPFPPKRGLPKNAAGAIARMRLELTTADANHLRPALPCTCDKRPNSAKHAHLNCPKWTTQRTTLLRDHNGPISWTALTETDICPKELRPFMPSCGLIQRRKIITNDEDMREADYELGADI